MSWTLFIITTVVSITVVRIGAVAFQLTGMHWSLAKFQALSCFSGTGFTTSEAELVTTHVLRRKIAAFLMILGNVGIVTLIASVANALSPQQTLWAQLSESIWPITVPRLLIPWLNLIMIILPLVAIYIIFTRTRISKGLSKLVRKRLVQSDAFQTTDFEELVVTTGGYGVVRIQPQSGSNVLNKTIAESQLHQNDVTVLAITRGDRTKANPSSDTQILEGDELTCFGKLDNIKKQMAVE